MNQISSLTALSGSHQSDEIWTYLTNRITDVLPLQGLTSLTNLNLDENTGLTTQKVSVLYTLLQANLNINNLTLPQDVDPPILVNIVEFNNPNLAAAVRTALRITKGYPVMTTGEKGLDTLERLTVTA